MAARMVDQGTVVQTPEQLEAWIASAPDERAVLQRDGYGTAFTAHDLFPLLQAAVARLGGPAPVVAEKAPPRSRTWMLVVFLVLLFAVLVYALVTNASTQMP